MSSTNTLALIPDDNEFKKMQIIANTAAVSGLYSSVGSEQKIFMILLAARELGILPMQALNGGIWNIQGKIEISARLMNAMIRRAGHSIRIVESTSRKCIIEGRRVDNGDTFTAQFTIEDAHAAGLSNRPTWKAYTEDMLFARAMSRLGRRLFSDVIGECFVEGEIREAKNINYEHTLVETVYVEENVKTDKEMIEEFCKRFPEMLTDQCVAYINKYCSCHKKTVAQAIERYKDGPEFIKHLQIWTDHNNAKNLLAEENK